MNERWDLRLLPQALMFIAVDAGFLETPGEAAQGTGGELFPDQ